MRGKTFGMTASRSRHPERFAGSCVRSHRRTRQSGGISLRPGRAATHEMLTRTSQSMSSCEQLCSLSSRNGCLKGFLSRSMALRMVNNLRMAATMATLDGLPSAFFLL
jgi:hypothetical protein